MSRDGYIVPIDVLNANRPKAGHDATSIPADPTLCLVSVQWDNPNHQAEFEAVEGVTHIGMPWEPIDPNVASLLASFGGEATRQSAMLSVVTPPPTVHQALKNVQWPAARLIR